MHFLGAPPIGYNFLTLWPLLYLYKMTLIFHSSIGFFLSDEKKTTFALTVLYRVLQRGWEDLRIAPCWENKATVKRRSHFLSRVSVSSWADRIHQASHRGGSGRELSGCSGEPGNLSCTYTHCDWLYDHKSVCAATDTERWSRST